MKFSVVTTEQPGARLLASGATHTRYSRRWWQGHLGGRSSWALLLVFFLCGVSFDSSAQQAPVGEVSTTRTLTCTGTMTNVSALAGGYAATCSSPWGQTDVKWVYNPATESQIQNLQSQIDGIAPWWSGQVDPNGVNDLLTAMLFFFVVLFTAREVYKAFKH